MSYPAFGANCWASDHLWLNLGHPHITTLQFHPSPPVCRTCGWRCTCHPACGHCCSACSSFMPTVQAAAMAA